MTNTRVRQSHHQDGKLIGTVTHVLVNDLTRGYGIFIENCWMQQVNGGKHMNFYEVPVGFGMALAMNPPALNAYSAMTKEQKQDILNRAHNARSKTEMHQIVNSIAR